MIKLLNTHNTDDLDINGTSLSGYLNQYTRQELTEFFGEPMINATGKVSTEWNLEVDVDGDIKIIAIYDWKYYFEDGAPADHHDWNVGARKAGAEFILLDLIDSMKKKA